jgi:hypothetical protein
MVMPTPKGSTAKKTTGGNGSDKRQESQKVIDEAIQKLQRLKLESVKAEPRKGGARTAKAPARPAVEEGVQIEIFEDDPFLEAVAGQDPVEARPIAVDVPENEHELLQTHIREEQPAPGLYTPDNLEFRYWNAASALARGINFWAPLLPEGTRWSSDQQPLQVELDVPNQTDLNAFYARDSGLNFFHDQVQDRTVFSGESPDVVCHELGHAILDAVKPELFDAMSAEVAAFHEAFGDMSSMLSALQLPSMRESVLEQTGRHLNANSRLSQLARQLGWAIRVKFSPTAVDTDCLRNTANQFFYQDPANLPTNAPASQLSSEPHSFSRVFSGAFLDVLASMFQVGPAGGPADDSDKLETIARDAGKLLIEGVRVASVGAGFYAQVAAGMIQADHSLNGGRYRAALTSSFVQRGILSPASAVALAKELQAHSGVAFGVLRASAGSRTLRFEGDNEGYKKTAKDAPALPLGPLTTRFGVTLHVHLPAEPNRFGVAAAAVTGGSERTFSPDEDARTFVEDLVQLDKISHEEAPGVIPAELTSPGDEAPSDKTHALVKEDGKTVLKRRHFDCGFAGCRRHR